MQHEREPLVADNADESIVQEVSCRDCQDCPCKAIGGIQAAISVCHFRAVDDHKSNGYLHGQHGFRMSPKPLTHRRRRSRVLRPVEIKVTLTLLICYFALPTRQEVIYTLWKRDVCTIQLQPERVSGSAVLKMPHTEKQSYHLNLLAWTAHTANLLRSLPDALGVPGLGNGQTQRCGSMPALRRNQAVLH
jgi:hypothetical protein